MKLCDYSLGPGGSGEGGAEEGDGMGCGYRAVTLSLFFFSRRQVRCRRRKNAPSDEGPKSPPPDSSLTAREVRGHLLASHRGSVWESEGVNILSSEAGSDKRSRR